MTPAEITNALAALQRKTQAVHTKAMTISMSNAPYSQIIAGLEEVMVTATNLTENIAGGDPVEGKDAAAISEAFKEFVRTQQVTLHLLTTKAGLFQSGQTLTVVDALRQDRDIIESLSATLIKLVPSKQAEIKTQQATISQTMRSAIRAHDRRP